MAFSFLDRLRSFRYAFAGLWWLLKSQRNAWIHLAATIAVMAAGFALHVSRADWCWLTIAVVMVWAGEAFNTAVESLADALHPEKHPLIGKAKDAGAGAVLICAIGAALIGYLVFAPHLAG